MPTGSEALDAALDGGFPAGSLVMVSGEVGAGATELALSSVQRAALDGRGARYATALRSPVRVLAEGSALFPGERLGWEAAAVAPPDPDTRHDLLHALGAGGVLVLESASALARGGTDREVVVLVERACDAAEEAGAAILLLHVPGTLPSAAELRIAERADGILRFGWKDGGPVRRRVLWIPRMRGLPPVLDAEEVPVFEVGVRRGSGLTVSRVKSVL